MARPRFETGAAECQRLRTTLLKDAGLELPPFKSFELRGALDYPAKILLYESPMPMYTTPPVAVFTLQRDLSYKAHPNPESFAHADKFAPHAKEAQTPRDRRGAP